MRLTRAIVVAVLANMTFMVLPFMARAQSLPVVEVNREIGVGFSDLLLNYKEHLGSDADGAHDRELGWTPGFMAHASIMFDMGPVKHLYVAANFNYNDGNVAYHGAMLLPPHGPVEDQSGATFKEMRAEIGKGFLLSDRLLITPVVHFGYRVWNRQLGETQEEDYRNFLLGLAVHVDFAATRRLVLRGRLGWAETLEPAITFNDISDAGVASSLQADLRSRPVWQAGVGIDYRVFRSLHVYGNVDYSRFSYGQSDTVFDPSLNSRILEPNSSTGSFVLETGLAIGL